VILAVLYAYLFTKQQLYALVYNDFLTFMRLSDKIRSPFFLSLTLFI
jgi:hypothetical protein